ncbi:MAG: DNA adenine methylase [Zoogloeaceae bacterium]|jgi:DNA adenine methylase|nr:DNA adenine methylase [Zoogloeaceae bacterium]
MKIPQPFQYQGSKRALAATILEYLPTGTERLIEPFAGSAAVSIACAARGRGKTFWLNDYNAPLSKLMDKIIHAPEEAAAVYQSLWLNDAETALRRYYQVREEFNRSGNPLLLLYLLARCVKGSVRYNADGLFNQSPDKRRLGARPETMRRNLLSVSAWLRGRTRITGFHYQEVLADCAPEDVVYMDPPYQGVCGERDARYFSGIDFDEFVAALARLNDLNIRFLVSYDGSLGTRAYGKPLPAALDLTRVEIHAGRSAQATLLGRQELTIESLYLSPRLAEELRDSAACQAICTQEFLFV